jgi:hypothetical protein
LAVRTTYRLSMFERGEESWQTLLNLVDGFSRMSTSFLYEAMVTDIALVEENGLGDDGPSAPPPFIEESPELGALKTIIELLQVNNHLNTGSTAKARVHKMPRPRSARDEVIARNTQRSFRALENSFKFVTTEQFEQTIREHEGQAVILDGEHVHRGNGDTGRRSVDGGVPPEAGGGPEGVQPVDPG